MTRRMTMDLYIEQLKTRYFTARKKDKKLILNEFCNTSGYHRKHAIRLLSLKKPKSGKSRHNWG